jgi:hypothetical protein
MLLIALAALAFAGSASAKLTGEYTRFQYCPYTTKTVERCIVAITEGGKVNLGSKEVPIEKPVTIQGGYTELSEEELEKGVEFAKFFGATNGITLSKAAQNVPGGLAGIVPKESSSPLVKALVKFFFENSLTGLTSTLELAKTASDIKISEQHLAEGEKTAMVLPVKVHLENPFLGKSCYVGSSTSPITWNLTTGKTSPPAPNTSISGKIGDLSFLEGATILRITENELVDNAWSAPGASGCGGIISFLVNPIINSQLGSTTAGHNAAKLKNTLYETTSFSLNKNNAEHP